MTEPVLKRLLLIPDLHAPYHDKRAWNLVLKVGRSLMPHHVVTIGDFMDCYTVSSYDRSPERAGQLETEIEAANECLDQLDTLSGDKHFVEGNHEARLAAYLCRKAPELYSLMNVKELLKLEERGWSHTPYRQFLRIGRLYLTHDTGNAGATAHTKAQAAFESNVVIGHTHRLAISYSGSAKGKSHVGCMLGWLGAVDQVDYAHRIQALRDWQLGFAIGYMEPSGNVHIQTIPIVEYKCCVNGKLFRG